MIKIKYNCPESDSAMSKTNCGFYCSSCSQDVFDFTEKSDDEIADLRANNPSISCGIFTAEQAVVDNRVRVRNLFRMAFAAIFVLGLNVSTLFGQTDNSVSDLKITTTEVTNESVFISGTIKSEKGNQIFGWISCSYGDEVVSIDSDEDGNFKIELPKDVIGHSVVLSIYASGYHLKEIELIPNSSKCYTYQIELKKYKKPFLRKNRMVRGKF